MNYMTQYFDPEFYHENGYNLYFNRSPSLTDLNVLREISLSAEVSYQDCVFFDNIAFDMSIFPDNFGG